MTTHLMNDQVRTDQFQRRPSAARGRLRRHKGAMSTSPSDESIETKVDVSFVIPLKDEQETIVELYDRISSQFGPESTIEFIFVDDGSSDGSWSVIESLVAKDPTRVRGLKFRGNCGKAAGLTAGSARPGGP